MTLITHRPVNPHHGERQHKANQTSGKGRGKGKKKAATPSPRPSPSASVAVSSDDDWPNRPQAVKPVPDPEQADHEPASLEEDAQDEGEATGLVKVKVRTTYNLYDKTAR